MTVVETDVVEFPSACECASIFFKRTLKNLFIILERKTGFYQEKNFFFLSFLEFCLSRVSAFTQFGLPLKTRQLEFGNIILE